MAPTKNKACKYMQQSPCFIDVSLVILYSCHDGHIAACKFKSCSDVLYSDIFSSNAICNFETQCVSPQLYKCITTNYHAFYL